MKRFLDLNHLITAVFPTLNLLTYVCVCVSVDIYAYFLLPGVYAVIDLYGQCAQVTITGGSGVQPPVNHLMIEETDQSLSSLLFSGQS